MVLGQGLVRTGALEPVGRALASFWGKAPALSLLATLLVGAVSVSVRQQHAHCRAAAADPDQRLPAHIDVAAAVLMPMGFATLVGGMATTIGTSTNLLVVSVPTISGSRRFGMFDFACRRDCRRRGDRLPVADRAATVCRIGTSSWQTRRPRLFDARLHIDDSSRWVGKTLAEVKAATDGDINVVRIRRGDTFVMPLPDVALRAGDSLRVRDTPAQLKAFENPGDTACSQAISRSTKTTRCQRTIRCWRKLPWFRAHRWIAPTSNLPVS